MALSDELESLAKRQYYYKVDGCPAVDSESPDCICWHDEGAGPCATADPTLVSWRGADQVLAMGRVPLTKREVELLDGMIAVQLDHADRCDSVPNRTMADRQKGWDMERVALLKKIKQGGQHGTE